MPKSRSADDKAARFREVKVYPLERLEQLEKAATPGPWQIPGANVGRVIATRNGEAHRCIVDDAGPTDAYFGQAYIGWPDGDTQWAENAKLIAALRNAAPKLLRLWRAAREFAKDGAVKIVPLFEALSPLDDLGKGDG